MFTFTFPLFGSVIKILVFGLNGFGKLSETEYPAGSSFSFTSVTLLKIKEPLASEVALNTFGWI